MSKVKRNQVQTKRKQEESQIQLNGLEKQTFVKLLLQEQWPKKRTKFITMWEAMPLQERKELIHEVYPYAPNSPEEETLKVKGETIDVKEGCVLLPHLTVSELSAGNNLIDLFNARGTPENDEAEIIQKDLAWVKSLIKKGAVDANLETIEKIVVFVSPQSQYGHAVELPPPPTPDDVQNWFDTEMIINESVFCQLFQYQQVTLSFLIEMLEKVKEKKLLKSTRRENECAKCNKSRSAEVKLMHCPCKRLQYCGKECQVADWGRHKVAHNKALKKGGNK